MTTSDTPDEDRLAESTDMLEEPSDSDPADLTQSAAGGTADKMHGEVDEIADSGDPGGTAAGHGPSTQ